MISLGDIFRDPDNRERIISLICFFAIAIFMTCLFLWVLSLDGRIIDLGNRMDAAEETALAIAGHDDPDYTLTILRVPCGEDADE